MTSGRLILSRLALSLTLLLGAAPPVNAAGPVPASPFPGPDKVFRIGKLENGLTWYVRRNSIPPNRVEMRLVVAAGGKQDEPGREGTAHLVEHLLFKGTARFPGGDLLRYLESIGLQPFADVNATTSHDNTSYFLKLPADIPAHVDQAAAILADFAHAATFPEEEVAREKAIVLAEWRQRTNADETARRRQEAVMHDDPRWFLGPLGNDESIGRIDRATVREFYTRWYTPDRMAIIVVGDVDVDTTISMIRRAFGPIPARSRDDAERISRTASTTRTGISLVTDEAVSGSWVRVATSMPEPEDAGSALCQAEVDRLFMGLLRSQVNLAFSNYGNSIQARAERLDDSTRVLQLESNVAQGHELAVLRVILRELERAAREGFDSLLVARELNNWRMIRDRWPELYSTRPSSDWIDVAALHFAWGDPILDASDARDLSGRCLDALAPSAGREWAQAWVDSLRRTVMLTVRPIAGEPGPTEAKIATALGEVASRRVEAAYRARRREELILDFGPPGTILSEVEVPENGMTVLTLSNGVDVWMKPIANGSSEIRIEAISPRGALAAPREDYFSALYSSEFAWFGGAGGFADPGWNTRMKGRAVRWELTTACLESRIDCWTGPTDLESAFESLYHTFRDLPINVGSSRTIYAFQNWQRRLAQRIEGVRTEPHFAYQQGLYDLLCDDHPLVVGPDLKQLGAMRVNRGLEFHRSVFGTISNFTLLVVGDFDPGVVRDYVARYIGSIPASEERLGYAQRCPFTFPRKPIQRRLTVGAKKAAEVALILPVSSDGPTRASVARDLACRYLNGLIQNQLRERLGAVYSTSVNTTGFSSLDLPPSLLIEFQCAPDSVETLRNTTLAILSEAPDDTISEARVAELQLGLKVDAEEDRLDSDVCLGAMRAAVRLNTPPGEVDFPGTGIDRITPALLRETLRRFIWPERAVSLVVVPEK